MVRAGRFFFALFSLFRYSLSIGLLERPLVIGLLWGLFTGDMTTSLYIAIFFELFWLDLIPVGTYIPPHLTAATLAALSLTTYFGLEHPARIMGILFACMPLAWLGAKAEGLLRDQERGGYNRLLNWSRDPASPVVPTQLILKALLRTFAVSWFLFLASTLVLKFTFETLFSLYPTFLTSVGITWPHLWVAAMLGGLMSLRLRRAYGVLMGGVTLIAIFMFFGRF
ncbi:hypothetical protein GM415_13700 [Pseudodesulfovibrio cashew]|uniref:Uncharacterized protein n=1 Tax=Pseudodesulfovibrio cashew TaxID=2678688 RepID=A0A6I6JE60_9BACT|nr:PTS sugar transporter subunit IIC [Pseudodesulfovibrio cashew]QGY41136.1 hypothetical protein GM415_13700 [Pseudodesulfovibrio cashew]